MNEVFDEVLALCLDRLSDGEEPSACATDFPDYPELRPLLEIAAAISAMPRPEPSPLWLVRSRRAVVDRAKQLHPWLAYE